MNVKYQKLLSTCLFSIFIVNVSLNTIAADDSSNIHVWEMKEISLKAEKDYTNYYTDITCWVELKGPDFSKRVYGFWDGRIFLLYVL